MSPAPDQLATARSATARFATARFATALRWLRWPVVVAWIILVVVLNGPASGLSAVTSNEASAYLPSSAPSTRVAVLQQAAAGSTDVDQAVVIFARSAGTRPAGTRPAGTRPAGTRPAGTSSAGTSSTARLTAADLTAA